MNKNYLKITALSIIRFGIVLLLLNSIQYAQISGYINSISGEGIPGINILLKNSNTGAATNKTGQFLIHEFPEGNFIIRISGIGYKSIEKEINLAKNEKYEFNFVLEEEVLELNSVLVEAKSEAEELRQKGFSISVLESSKQKNLTTDINQVIKSAPGIHLRESGGLGSGFNLSLNGLSGNQIRYFIDGIPMENFGSALTLNNYPINLIDKLEIYKGVVPISLGSDALGGAINIITDYWQKSFLDVAYSFGSFNTHRVSLNSQYANREGGYFLKGAFFLNHSDNNYMMKDVPLYDLELGNYFGQIETKRFHDEYTSLMFHAEAGLFDKSWVDKMSVRVTVAGGRKNYQHPDNNIKRVFGEFHTKNKSFLLSTNYNKQIERFTLSAYAISGIISQSVIDTSSRRFNWAGEYTYRNSEDHRGELFERRTYSESEDFIIRSNFGIGYTLSDHHKIDANFSQNYLKRSGEEKVDVYNRAFDFPNHINKHLLGLALSSKFLGSTLETNLFGKQYWYSGKITTQDYSDNDIVTQPTLSKTGFGMAVVYNVSPDWLVKTSFEKAYRIPESYEILGDGIYVNPNPNLQPEKSNNFNLGMRNSFKLQNLMIKTEANYFYRYSEDFIRFKPLGPFGEYENLSNVKTEGIEASVDFNYRELVSLTTNITYQKLTDQTEFDVGLPNTNYQSRVPNIPYLFANMRIGYSPSDPTSFNKFQLYWSFRYVHEFFLTWENLGNKNEKNIIPSQFINDISAEYSMAEGTYNISASINNLFDQTAYDNFSIQKPGRSFSIKLRYSIK
jgi:outer membrane receptor protein involved in Fe transport